MVFSRMTRIRRRQRARVQKAQGFAMKESPSRLIYAQHDFVPGWRDGLEVKPPRAQQLGWSIGRNRLCLFPSALFPILPEAAKGKRSSPGRGDGTQRGTAGPCLRTGPCNGELARIQQPPFSSGDVFLLLAHDWKLKLTEEQILMKFKKKSWCIWWRTEGQESLICFCLPEKAKLHSYHCYKSLIALQSGHLNNKKESINTVELMRTNKLKPCHAGCFLSTVAPLTLCGGRPLDVWVIHTQLLLNLQPSQKSSAVWPSQSPDQRIPEREATIWLQSLTCG